MNETKSLTQESECPNCDKRTLSKRGITVERNDGSTGGARWLGCINCDWDSK